MQSSSSQSSPTSLGQFHRIASLATIIALILNLLAPLGAVAHAAPAGAPPASPPAAPGQSDSVLLLVKFKSSASAADADTAIRAVGAESVRNLSQIRTRIVRVPAAARDRMIGAFRRQPAVQQVNAAVTFSRAGDPSDAYYAQQWALPKIGWDQAYNVVAINGTAAIAVLDTGVDANHPDLAGRVVGGQSFLGDGTGDPNVDPNGHGTALAGIAAASVDNGEGIAGVAYAGTSVQSVQVLGADGLGSDADVVPGVLWAADNGAKVILMGFSSADASAALADALAYAWSKGVVLVAATGNNGATAPSYPAGLPNVIGVAATDRDDNVASSSNTGSAAVAAPGVEIAATRPGGQYGNVSGTSASSAEVAGLAALLIASGKSNAEASDQIRGATDPVAGASFGRINVAQALGAQTPPQPTTTAQPTPEPGGTATPVPTYVAAATLTLSPIVGKTGGSVTASGTGYGSSKTITFRFDGATVTTTSGPCSTNNGGNFSNCTFNVPNKPDGTYTVSASDGTGSTSGTATTSFTVDNTAPAAPSAPALASASDSGVKGDNITNVTTPTFTGTAEAGSTVRILANGNQVGSGTATGGNYSITTSALAAGTITITATATDAAGNTSAASSSVTLVIDTTAPAAPSTPDLDAASDSGSSNTDNITNVTMPTFTGTAEANATVGLFRGGTTSLGTTTANGSGNWSLTLSSPLAGGTYSITARTTDAAGNTGTASSALSIIIDTSAPTSAVTSPSNGATISSLASVSGSASDTGSSVASVSVSLRRNSDNQYWNGSSWVSGEAWLSTTGTTSWSSSSGLPSSANLADGGYTVRSQATDTAGNVQTPGAGNTFTIDNTAPAAPSSPVLAPASDSGVQGDNITNDNTPTFTGTAEAGSTVRILANGTQVGSGTAAANGSYSITTSTLADGSYNITATASDAAGNTSAPSSPVTVIIIDTAAPGAPSVPDLDAASDSGSSNTDNITNVTTPKFNGTAAANTTVQLFRGGTISLGTTTADGSGNWSLTLSSPLSNGTYSITARATDTAGNTSAASGALSITIDTTAPPAPTLNSSINSDTGASSSDRITSDTTPTISGSTEVNGTVELYDGATLLGTVTGNQNNGNWSFTVPLAKALSDGEHSITARATDTAGNSVTSTPLVITIDTQKPASTISFPANGGTYNSAAWAAGCATAGLCGTADGTGSGVQRVQVTIKRNSDNQFWDGSKWQGQSTLLNATGTTSWSYAFAASNLTSGTSYTIQAQATDIAGNLETLGAGNIFTYINDTIAPTATMTAPADGSTSNDTTPTLTANATDNVAVASVQFQLSSDNGATWNNVGAADTTAPYAVTVSPALVQGSYRARAIATDTAGNQATSTAVSFTVDTTAPSVSSIDRAGATPTSAASVSFAVTFSENVSGVDATDFALATAGVTNASITSVTGSGSSYTVVVNTGSGNGTIGLNLVDNDSIADVAGNKLGGTGTGNGNFTGQVYTISKIVSTTLAADPATGTYGGTTTLKATLSPAVSGKTISFSLNGTAVGTATTDSSGIATLAGVSLAGINADTYAAGVNSGVSASFAGDSGYSASNATNALTVTPKSLTPSVTVNDKVYDGTTTATINTRSLSGVVAGDTVSLIGGSATFATKNAGAGKSVSVTGLSLTGADAANYSLASTTLTAQADITPKSLTGDFTAADKAYDGTTAATISGRSLAGVVAGDSVSLSGGSATFADKNAGDNKTVTGTGFSLTGADAANYSLASATLTAQADITPKSLTGSFTAADKAYDGTTAATISGRSLAGVVAGDSVSLTGGSATFANKNAGDNKTVTGTGFSLTGADAANYSLASTTLTAQADITLKALTGTIAANDKVYDGTTTAIATGTLSGDVAFDDEVSLVVSGAAFSSKQAGTDKTVTASLSLTGADAANYSVNPTASAKADITPRALTVTASASDKVYDGTTAASVTLSDNRVAGDVLSASYASAAFADKNVGTAKTVTVTGITISGADAANYTHNTTATDTASITRRALTVTANASDKVYDGTTTATATLATNKLAGDVVSASYTSAAFTDKNAGAGKTVTVTGISISGADAANYTHNTTATDTASITRRALTVTANASDKVYDGTTVASVTLVTNKLDGDTVSASYTGATFADKNVGTAKTVTVTGITISGADAVNYTHNTSATDTASITAKSVTGTFTASSKVYDGTNAATIATRTLSGAVNGDDVSLVGGTATFANKNVGTDKTVTATGFSLSGADADNYSLASTTLTTKANITQKSLVGSITANDKVYDGTNAATIATRTLSGVEADDTVSLIGGTATFADKQVGDEKTVTVTGLSLNGADAGNYVVNTIATAKADITPRALTVTASGINKVYDGTTVASVTLATNKLDDDTVSASYTSATFADKNVGTAKTVIVTGITISGADAANYTANTTASTIATITAKALTGSITAANKVYDGTNAATIATRTLSGVVSGDDVSLTGGTATFANKNVGAGKLVTATGLSLGGANAANYTVNSSATATANITARALTVTATGINKVYDGTLVAGVTLSDDRVAGDVLSSTYTSATFADKNVGTAKAVTVTGISISGADAANYTFNTTASTTANITARPLTVTATGINKVYDGTTVASVTLATNKLADDTVSASYTGATFADPSVGTAKTVTVTGITISGADAGNYTANTTASTTASITAKALTVTANNASRQYSDPNPPFTVSYSGFVSGENQTSLGGTLGFDTPATASSPQGSYDIWPKGLTSNNYAITFAKGTLTVTREDARVTYTGATYVSTGSATNSSATVTLAATIQDITAVTGDASYDAYPGDIRNATIQFVNRDSNNTVLCSGTIGLVSSLDTKTGTATCNWTANVGTGESSQYTIGVIIQGNYYYRNDTSDNTVVTVSKAIPGMLAGGGFLINQRSAGQRPGETGLRTNFGFNVKTTKTGGFQGNVNIIVRNGGRVYQIKSNAITSFGSALRTNCATAPFCTSTFNGKANIQDITNPLAPVSVDGNATLQIKVTDKGEPGSSDSVAITLWNKDGGLWFSSNWSGTSTVEQTLSGGNVQVR